jgi:hypothetical protein
MASQVEMRGQETVIQVKISIVPQRYSIDILKPVALNTLILVVDYYLLILTTVLGHSLSYSAARRLIS